MISPKLRNERLRKLAAYLITLPKERKFFMGHWGSHKGSHKPTSNNFCGTSACVLGHAAMIPEFRRDGLKMEWTPLFDNFDENGEPIGKAKSYEGSVHFKTREGVMAGEAFFGLTPVEGNNLFLESMASTALEKAQEVIALIQD